MAAVNNVSLKSLESTDRDWLIGEDLQCMPEVMLHLWLREFLNYIKSLQPGFIALHCQEVGGKNYEDSMQHVNLFVKALLAADELEKYDRARIFLDEDFTAADKFTALGNLYFVHESMEDVKIWDFEDCAFTPLEGREVLSGNIENIRVKEKAKFPQHFFPEFKWSRKGFLRTRWCIDSCQFDLVNIHLFHDASNLVAMETNPSLYSDNRRNAFQYTMDRFETDKYDNLPMFVFGDFNFRLNCHLLFKELTEKATPQETKGKKGQVSKLTYTENGKAIMTVEPKYFNYHEKHEELFLNTYNWLRQFDLEMESFKARLFEYEINFAPTYPFSEETNDGMSYCRTRCPSWCDRILLSPSAKDIVLQNESIQPKYHIMGKEICTGDHKPVYLFIHMRTRKGKFGSGKRLSTRSRVLSINGEPVPDVEMDEVNIHYSAVFEKEHKLQPEARTSIKARSVKGTLTFHDIAHHVVLAESVLRTWPRRNRHHSSSSEDDLNDNQSDAENKPDDSLNSTPVKGRGDIIDITSINTVVSDLSSPSEETELIKSDGPESPIMTPPKSSSSPISSASPVSSISPISSDGGDSTAGDRPLITSGTGSRHEHAYPPARVTTPTSQVSLTNDIIIPNQQVKISEVDSTKYIHVKQNGASTRVFKETTV